MVLFKKSWKSSKSVRNQRKFRFNAPIHIKRKFLSAHLSTDLKKKYNKRSVVVCKGDKIKVLRGNFKGHENVVKSVNIKEGKILISGIEVIKKDGTKVPQKVNPSNMLITSLNLEDKKRKLSLERKNE